MTTFPKTPALRAPATIKDQGSRLTRTEARVDDMGSVQSQHTAQIATANTAITANTTAITTNTTNIATGATNLTALETRLGGNTQETFLGSLNQIANFGLNASGGWTTGGALQAGTWDNTHATALVGFMNAVFADLTDLLQAFRNAGII